MKRNTQTKGIYRQKTEDKKDNGQLVMLGCDIAACTPASYQRHSL